MGMYQPGLGAASQVPPEVRGFSWGGFGLTFIWAFANGVMWAGIVGVVLFFLFGIAIFPAWYGLGIYLGIKGNELAWKNKRWNSVQHFRDTQHTWAVWGVVFFVFITLVYIIGAIVLIAMIASDAST